MALRFKVISVHHLDADRVMVRATYFDSEAPAVILGRANLHLPATTTKAEARAAIIAEGQRLRAGLQARARLAEDIGAEGNVT